MEMMRNHYEERQFIDVGFNDWESRKIMKVINEILNRIYHEWDKSTFFLRIVPGEYFKTAKLKLFTPDIHICIELSDINAQTNMIGTEMRIERIYPIESLKVEILESGTEKEIVLKYKDSEITYMDKSKRADEFLDYCLEHYIIEK